MAGIGFELETLFKRKGILSTLRAYGYTAIVCVGPMLLGVILLLSVRLLAEWGGALWQEQDFLVSMITYCLLASLIYSNTFSVVTTRFVADMLYLEKVDCIIPSLFGSTALLLVLGAGGYGTFLFFSGVELIYKLLCLVLFSELIMVWSQINYISAIKDYRKVLSVFLGGTAAAIICGFVFIILGVNIVVAMMMAVCCGYGFMIVGYYSVLLRYFPYNKNGSFTFLKWLDRYPSLILNGIFTSIGLFAHLIIIWFSPIGIHVEGQFYSAPLYDIPALIAFLTTLVTTVNFIASTEVKFYPKYRRYFDLFNEGGTMTDIEFAEQDMLIVMRQELFYLALKQFIVSILAIAVGRFVLQSAYLGFNHTTLGTFHILCIGYGVYAVANNIMLILLYFSDYRGALIAVISFAFVSTSTTLFLLNNNFSYYGFGFFIGTAVMYITVVLRLNSYTKKLQYHVLTSQPVLKHERIAFWTKLGDLLERWLSEEKRDVEITE